MPPFRDDAAPSDGPPCPRCAAPLVARPLADAEILACRGCRGAWLGPAVLTAVLVEAAARAAALAADTALRSVEREVRTRMCVVCGAPMMRHNVGRTSGIVVDRCVDHGAWFDAGELAAALRFQADRGAPTPAPSVPRPRPARRTSLTVDAPRSGGLLDALIDLLLPGV